MSLEQIHPNVWASEKFQQVDVGELWRRLYCLGQPYEYQDR